MVAHQNNAMKRASKIARAATLIETLVVLAIIAILVGLLFPAMHYARESARRATCQANLHQLAIAYRHFLEVRGKFHRPTPPDGSISGWAIDILPFMEDQDLADGLSGSPILDPESPVPLSRKRPYIMTCPSGYEGDSNIRMVPPSHYTLAHALGDIRVDSRVPWVFSPRKPLGGPSAMMPHGGGYNVIALWGETVGAARFVSGE